MIEEVSVREKNYDNISPLLPRKPFIFLEMQ